MSKLAVIRQYRYSPAAGNIFSGILSFGAKLLGIGKKAAPVVEKVLKNPVAQGAIAGGLGAAAGALTAGGSRSSGGASGTWRARRGRGITARELRGYRKVANLIHKEGMVSKRARGRH